MSNDNGTVFDAVMDRDEARVRSLIASGADLEAADEDGQTGLILAAKTDQFRIAEVLLDGGADPFAASRFGWTAGYAAETSRLERGPEFEARQRVIEKLRERGYPVPGPDKPEIKRMLAEGRWPPAPNGTLRPVTTP